MSLKDLGITVRKGSPLDPNGTREAERAVIEAAKALVDPDQCRGWFSLYTRLVRAVEALEVE